MASVISLRRSHTDPVAQPNLRLVEDRTNRVEAPVGTPGESPKTAVIACLTARSASNGDLLRKARRAARENDGELYAVLVDSPRTRLGRVQAGALLDDVILASYFGARIVSLKSSDVVGELIEFGRQSRVGRIFVARNQPRPHLRAFGRSVYSDLLSRAEGFRIDVVGLDRKN
jgi:K+-sensing histidine kinase KdpD